MPAVVYDERLLSEVLMTTERGRWQVYVRYDGRRYGFGTFLTYGEARHACSISALEKALSSPDTRVARLARDE